MAESVTITMAQTVTIGTVAQQTMTIETMSETVSAVAMMAIEQKITSGHKTDKGGKYNGNLSKNGTKHIERDSG